MDRRRLVLVLAILLPTTAVRAAESCDAFGFREAVVEPEPGIELFVRHGGAGEPAVVVPGDFLLFDHLCPLAAHRRVIFYDMRNRGRSGRVTDGDRLTLEADLRDLEAVRAHFGLDRMALVGYSYLGKMVVRFALDHAGTVSRLVQLGAVPMDPDRTFPPQLVEPPLTSDQAYAEELAELRARRAEGPARDRSGRLLRARVALGTPGTGGGPGSRGAPGESV